MIRRYRILISRIGHFSLERLIGLLLLGSLLAGCISQKQADLSQADPADPTDACSSLFIQAQDLDVYQSGLSDTIHGAQEQVPAASIYAIQVTIDKDYQALHGCEWVRYTNRESVALEEMYFMLYPNRAGGKVTISGAQVGDQDIEPVLEKGANLRIPLSSPLQPGETVDLWLAFELEMPEEPGGNYGLLAFSENVLLLNNFYPVIPVYDNEGWNLEFPPPYGDTTYLDASYYLVQVTAPEKLALISSGVEIDRIEETNQQTVTIAAGPGRDFYLAGSTRGQMFSQQAGEVTVRVLAGKNYQECASRLAQYAADALVIFSNRFGDYPYRELDLIVGPLQAMGMEYPGAILLTSELVSAGSDIDYRQESILEAVVVHEVAHQWFYNLVGNDQVDEPWLDEAFAQYATYLYYLDRYSESAANSYRSSWSERWNRAGKAKLPIGLSSAEYSENEYVAIVYGRGPYFLQALEQEMGEVVFAAMLRDYVSQTAWGITTTDSFRALAEDHCECDLGVLFEEWVLPLEK